MFCSKKLPDRPRHFLFGQAPSGSATTGRDGSIYIIRGLLGLAGVLVFITTNFFIFSIPHCRRSLSCIPFVVVCARDSYTIPASKMPPVPEWVKALKPTSPQGSELLQQERDSSNVSVDKLAELIHTKDVLDRQQKILAIMEKEKVFDKSQILSMGRVERLTASLGKAKRIQHLRKQHNWTDDEFIMANDLLSEPTPYALHASMFLVRSLFAICLWERIPVSWLINCIINCLGDPQKSVHARTSETFPRARGTL